MAPEEFYIVGCDSDKFLLKRAESNSSFLVPSANDPNYIAVLNSIIDDESIDFVHAQNDAEVGMLSARRNELRAMTFFPDPAVVRICQNKLETYEHWERVGMTVPRTILLTSETDLRTAFREFGGEVWLRAIEGAGGRGSLPARDIDTAIRWVELQHGWGTMTASELLEVNSVTWMSLWCDGELVVAQGRKRLYWELSRIAPSGVTGVTGGGVTFQDDELDMLAVRAISAVDSRPNGLYGVDFTYDNKGMPNPTEINIGRFFTTHFFFTMLGLNMPYQYVQCAFNDLPPRPWPVLNPLPNGKVWIRGVDFLPVLTEMEQVNRAEHDLANRMNQIDRS
jgi:carbamoyl-phosphate synthase large subunit